MLDRSKPYGTIFPATYAAFKQDGKLFDHDGEEVDERPELVTVADPIEETHRHIDLRRKENAHLRPSARKAA